MIQDLTIHILNPSEQSQSKIINIYNRNNNLINYITYYGGYSGPTGPHHYITENISTNINDLIVDYGVTRLIPEERRTCGINLDEIQINQRYMYCSQCLNNFNEQSIRRWLQDRRTCPTCRGNWIDFNIYINS